MDGGLLFKYKWVHAVTSLVSGVKNPLATASYWLRGVVATSWPKVICQCGSGPSALASDNFQRSARCSFEEMQEPFLSATLCSAMIMLQERIMILCSCNITTTSLPTWLGETL